MLPCCVCPHRNLRRPSCCQLRGQCPGWTFQNKRRSFNELVQGISGFSLPCWRLSSTSYTAGDCCRAASLLCPPSLSRSCEKAGGRGAVAALEQQPWLERVPGTSSLRHRPVPGGSAFEELSFKAASPTSCTRTTFSPETSVRV